VIGSGGCFISLSRGKGEENKGSRKSEGGQQSEQKKNSGGGLFEANVSRKGNQSGGRAAGEKVRKVGGNERAPVKRLWANLTRTRVFWRIGKAQKKMEQELRYQTRRRFRSWSESRKNVRGERRMAYIGRERVGSWARGKGGRGLT